jgi:hypothetical protein
VTTDSQIETRLLRLRAQVAAAAVVTRLRLLADAFKYDPDQPRVPAGSPEGGQWTSTGGANDDSLASDEGRNQDGEVSVESILAIAPRLAAARTRLDRCIDICSPLLERFQRPGSDRNEFDFRKCLNACLGR